MIIQLQNMMIDTTSKNDDKDGESKVDGGALKS